MNTSGYSHADLKAAHLMHMFGLSSKLVDPSTHRMLIDYENVVRANCKEPLSDVEKLELDAIARRTALRDSSALAKLMTPRVYNDMVELFHF